MTKEMQPAQVLIKVPFKQRIIYTTIGKVN